MSYRCGIYEPLATILGVEPGPPRVKCDHPGCLAKVVISDRRPPPRWLLDGKAPPRWRTVKSEDGSRVDRCPTHKDVM